VGAKWSVIPWMKADTPWTVGTWWAVGTVGHCGWRTLVGTGGHGKRWRYGGWWTHGGRWGLVNGWRWWAVGIGGWALVGGGRWWKMDSGGRCALVVGGHWPELGTACVEALLCQFGTRASGIAADVQRPRHEIGGSVSCVGDGAYADGAGVIRKEVCDTSAVHCACFPCALPADGAAAFGFCPCRVGLFFDVAACLWRCWTLQPVQADALQRACNSGSAYNAHGAVPSLALRVARWVGGWVQRLEIRNRTCKTVCYQGCFCFVQEWRG
jgi:hypothetical protein